MALPLAGCAADEDRACRQCYAQAERAPLKRMLPRLSTVIQNLHLLMIQTETRLFDACLLRLFRRYFVACNLCEDADKAHSAWLSLHQAQQTNVLEHPKVPSPATSLAELV